MEYRSNRSLRAKQQTMLSTSNVVIEWNTTQLNESARVYPPRSRNDGMASKASFKEEPHAVHSVMLSPGGKQRSQKHSGESCTPYTAVRIRTCIFFFVSTAAAISGSKNYIIFSESLAAPGVPLVYRTPEGKTADPERVNLDRYIISGCTSF